MNNENYFKIVHKAISERFNCNEKEFLTKSRKRELVYLRQLFCYFSYNEFNQLRHRSSLEQIGNYIAIYRGENYDHTSVINSCKRIRDQLSIYENVRKDVYELRRIINQEFK